MSDTDIKFRLSQSGAEPVASSFDKVTSSQRRMTNSTGESRQAMVEFGRIIQDAPYGINGVANNVTRLAELMGAGGPLLLGLSLVSSALVVWAGNNRKAKEETDLFTSAIESQVKALIKARDYQYEFLINPEDVQMRLDQVGTMMKKFRDEAEFINAGAGAKLGKGGAFAQYFVNLFASGELTKAEKDRLKILEEIQNQLEKNKATLEAQLEIENIMNEMGVTGTSKSKEKGIGNDSTMQSWNKSIGEFTGWIMSLANAFKYSDEYLKLLNQDINVMQPNMKKVMSIMAYEGLQKREGGKHIAPDDIVEYLAKKKHEALRAQQELYSPLVDGFDSAMSVINSNWQEGWEKMFGEANSMFEQFLSNWTNKLFNRALGNIFDYGLMTLTGGSSGFFGKLFGSGFRQSTGQTIIVNTQIGNQTVARVVAKGNKQAEQYRYSGAY